MIVDTDEAEAARDRRDAKYEKQIDILNANFDHLGEEMSRMEKVLQH